jgi:hypothetical protein
LRISCGYFFIFYGPLEIFVTHNFSGHIWISVGDMPLHYFAAHPPLLSGQTRLGNRCPSILLVIIAPFLACYLSVCFCRPSFELNH